LTPLLLALAFTASATQVTARDVPCALGAGTARVYEKVSTNAAGGYDSDGATYSSAGQWRTYRIATCAPSLLTLYGSDMRAPVPAERRAAVTSALQSAVAALPNPATPEVWERYGLAAAVYKALGRDDLFLAELWVEASWTARDAAVGYYANLQGPTATRALLDSGAKELAKPLAPADVKKVTYNLARVAHRGGYAAERDRWLTRFEAAGALDPQEREALARFRRLAGTVEPALQDKAIAHYTAALRGSLTHTDKVRATFVLADLLRRRGREREALPLYSLVANDTQAPPDLRATALALAKPIAEALPR
jgi:hypothetical protein